MRADPQHLAEDRFGVVKQLHGTDEGDAIEGIVPIIGQPFGDIALIDGQSGRDALQHAFLGELHADDAAGARL